MWITRKLDNVLRDLIPLEQRGKAVWFLNSTEDVNRLGSLVEDVWDAVLEYQVRPWSGHSHLS